MDYGQKSSVFGALGIVGVAVLFLAGASFVGKVIDNRRELIETEPAETTQTLYYAPSMTETESYPSRKTTTKTVADSAVTCYESGTYAVGTDIPAGLYLAVADASNPDGLFLLDIYNRPVVKGSNMRSIKDIDWWQNYGYIELEEGQYIELTWANLYPADKTDIHPDPWQTCGMFRVGTDIAPGTYILSGNSHDAPGEYSIYDSAKADANLIKEDYCFDPDLGEAVKITLHDGEYLMTKFSIITEEAEADPLPEYAFPAGAYEVNEPGLYVALADDTAENGSFRLDVYDSAESKEILIGGWSQNCRYVELEENQMIDFSDSVLYPADLVTMPDPYTTPGMYRAGYDFSAGTCTIKANSTLSAMVIVYDSAGKNAVPLISRQLKDGYAEIELHDGEFLEMRNCVLES